MKERYIAPAAEVICFAPAENLAVEWVTTWDWSTSSNSASGVSAAYLEVGVETTPASDGVK